MALAWITSQQEIKLNKNVSSSFVGSLKPATTPNHKAPTRCTSAPPACLPACLPYTTQHFVHAPAFTQRGGSHVWRRRIQDPASEANHPPQSNGCSIIYCSLSITQMRSMYRGPRETALLLRHSVKKKNAPRDSSSSGSPRTPSLSLQLPLPSSRTDLLLYLKL